MVEKTGKCLCGAVKFTVRDLADDFGACHCKMCQRWAGSSMLNVTVPNNTITFDGSNNIQTYKSSDWAERAWCSQCGSGIWYKVTADTEFGGTYHIPVGLFDDPSGLKLKRQFFTDTPRAGYSFADKTENMTEADVWAKYAPNNSGSNQV